MSFLDPVTSAYVKVVGINWGRPEGGNGRPFSFFYTGIFINQRHFIDCGSSQQRIGKRKSFLGFSWQNSLWTSRRRRRAASSIWSNINIPVSDFRSNGAHQLSQDSRYWRLIVWNVTRERDNNMQISLKSPEPSQVSLFLSAITFHNKCKLIEVKSIKFHILPLLLLLIPRDSSISFILFIGLRNLILILTTDSLARVLEPVLIPCSVRGATPLQSLAARYLC